MLVVSDVKTCPLCSTTRNFKSSHLLYEHIRVCHKGEKAASMKVTDTHREWKAARQERRVPSAKSKTHILTDAQKTAVAVVPAGRLRLMLESSSSETSYGPMALKLPYFEGSSIDSQGSAWLIKDALVIFCKW